MANAVRHGGYGQAPSGGERVTRRALVTEGGGSERLSIREVPDAVAAPGAVLVEVHAISVNRGEVHRIRTAAAGWIPGWDLAGVVSASPDGTLSTGTRVVGTLPAPGSGAWAEVVSVPTTQVAPLPDAVSFTQAAALPVAALTALRALRAGGPLLGRRVVITGAAGGVGRFAIQLAKRAGAEVTAIVGSAERGRGLAELGADHVVTDVTTIRDRYDVILESAGGGSLAHLAAHVEPYGTLVIFGNSSGELTTFNARDVYMGGSVRLQGFSLPSSYRVEPPARDLGWLAELVGSGDLDPQVADVLPWNEVGTAFQRVEARSVPGKIVLAVR